MKISSFTSASSPKLSDKLIGTKVGGNPADGTFNFTISSVIDLFFSELPFYTDNAAALAGGLTVGKGYKTPSGEVRVVV